MNSNSKGKQKEISAPPPSQRRIWNENISQGNTAERLTQLEKKLDQFTELLNKFNNRLNNLEMHVINQPQQPQRQTDLNFGNVDMTFTNSNNKRAKTVQAVRDQSGKVVPSTRIISSDNDGFMNLPNTEISCQTTALSAPGKLLTPVAPSIPVEVLRSLPSTESNNDMVIDSQPNLQIDENTRISNMEKKMDSAFASLSGFAQNFDSWLASANQGRSPTQSNNDTAPSNNHN
jgi:hypothetical protein